MGIRKVERQLVLRLHIQLTASHAAWVKVMLLFTTTEQCGPAHLPPVRVLLIYYMENLSLGEGQTSLFTRAQVVCGRVIVEVWLQINLQLRM